MKTFFEEYGLSVIIGCVICLLVVMASPVGGAINNNLKTSAKNMGDTGTEVQAKAGNSIKSMAAGESAEEDVPDTIFVGYNTFKNHLIFTSDENSEGYQGCDTKYGDVQNNIYTKTNRTPWYSPCYMNSPKIIIENKIKPKHMDWWFYKFAGNGDVGNMYANPWDDRYSEWRNFKNEIVFNSSNLDSSQLTSVSGMVKETKLEWLKVTFDVDLSHVDQPFGEAAWDSTPWFRLYFTRASFDSIQVKKFENSSYIID